MMLENDFFIELRSYVFELVKSSLPPQIVYHNFNHTEEVVKAAYEIGVGENISEAEMEVLLVAAWFHDVGFVEGHENHEDSSKKIAENYLKSKNFDTVKIEQVRPIIEVTKMPQSPKTTGERIMCDADLFHLGAEDFKVKSNLLRTGWSQTSNKVISDEDWLRESEKFFLEHKYFTNYAFEKLNAQKTLNVLRIQKDLKKIEKKELTRKLKSENLKEKGSRPDRGIETMFRVTLKNHIKLSDIADTKANILLSVSAIILSIALSTLFPKLDKPDNAFLIYPTLIFVFIAVVTMIYSILSTRPKVTSGKFTKKDIENKKVNLLFFGNFHKMPLDDFQEGISEMMNDRDYLYKSLAKDLYYLGIVLSKKYKLLRVAYTIFMIGIIVSVLAFFISFALMKNS